MNSRENMLRAIRFEQPDHIPMLFHINSACWHHYDQNRLQDLVEAHPFLFPGFKRQDEVRPILEPTANQAAPYTDSWGCVWETTDDGIAGRVSRHPLADWSGFDHFRPPDPDKADGMFPVDWDALRKEAARARADGDVVRGSLPHGHTFLRLQDIRGYENFLLDMLSGEPRLDRLIAMVEEFNQGCVSRWMDLDLDIMAYPDDLGMQVGPMLSPDLFRKYIKPVYQRLMKPARDRGCIVHMHSDGDIRQLVDDLIEGGVQVINLQDLVNGIEWIRDRFAGRVCIDLDIDRQSVTVRGTPAEVDRLVRREVELLGSKKGGLMLCYGMYPGVPLENAAALMDAMEKYAGYYA